MVGAQLSVVAELRWARWLGGWGFSQHCHSSTETGLSLFMVVGGSQQWHGRLHCGTESIFPILVCITFSNVPLAKTSSVWPVPAPRGSSALWWRSCKPLQLQNKSTMWVDTLRLILLSSPHKKTVPIDSPNSCWCFIVSQICISWC